MQAGVRSTSGPEHFPFVLEDVLIRHVWIAYEKECGLNSRHTQVLLALVFYSFPITWLALAAAAEDEEATEHFLHDLDSAILLHNASTQFADGGEFGMGAEIGIATGKIHARGPVGAEQLTSYKYVVRGTGQIRPWFFRW